MLRFSFVFFAIGLAPWLTGCTAPDAPDDTDAAGAAAADEAPVAEIESALCTDAGVPDFSAALGGDGSTVRHTSPSRTYGSTACADEYVVQATATLGKNVRISATWGEALPTTQQSCPFALLSATAYGLRQDGTWVQIGSQAVTGQWTTPPLSSPTCSIDARFSVASSPYTRVRIAAKAAALVLIATDPRKVTGSIAVPHVIP